MSEDIISAYLSPPSLMVRSAATGADIQRHLLTSKGRDPSTVAVDDLVRLVTAVAVYNPRRTPYRT